MSKPKDEKINFNNKEDVLLLFNEVKAENPDMDELEILTAVAHIAGWDTPPTSKLEGKKIILKILKINE